MRVPRHWLTSFSLKEKTLLLTFPKPRLVISSAVLGGGIRRTQVVVNHQVNHVLPGQLSQVEQKKIYENPKHYLRQVIKQLTGRTSGVGLMTAVDLRHLLQKRITSGPLWVEGFFTVGITNAVCVGKPIPKKRLSSKIGEVGTINMILMTNASLGPGALVGAIGVATESKAAVMLEHSIDCWIGQKGATGTGTDSIVFVSGDGPPLSYSGTHTKIGELIGRVVRMGIGHGLRLIKRSALEVRP